jgi:excisionase family DNA binding protein
MPVKLYGAKDASELLFLSEGTVKNLCAAGKIKADKIGPTWVIQESNLKKYMKERQEHGGLEK